MTVATFEEVPRVIAQAERVARPRGLEMSRRLVISLAVALSMLSVATTSLVWRDQSLLLFNDAFAHLKIARFVVDGAQPGLSQLGSGWLPLAHVAMLAFVWNDWAFRTGLAGAIPSGLAFVAGGIGCYALGLHVGRSHLAGAVSLLAFASNPNVLYMSAVPMTESLFLALTIGATYALVRWAQDPAEQRFLALAAGFTMLATLTRYEGWGMAAGGAVLVAYIAWRRCEGSHAALAHAFTFGLIASYGIALWLVWNALIFGDALYFRRGEFSATAINGALLEGLGGIRPATEGQLLGSLLEVARTGELNAGAALAATGVLGFALWLVRGRLRAEHLGVLLILGPPAMLAASLFSGDTVIFLPDRDGRLFNIRYGLVLVPALAAFAGYLGGTRRELAAVVGAGLLWQSYALVATGGPVTYVDATRGVSGGVTAHLSTATRGMTSFDVTRPLVQWLETNYDSGRVLMDSSTNNQIVVANLPTHAFLTEGVFREWDAALEEPDRYVDWIVMRRGGTGTLRDRVATALADSPALDSFAPVLELDGVTILLRADRLPEWTARHPGAGPIVASVSVAPQTPVTAGPPFDTGVRPTSIAIAALPRHLVRPGDTLTSIATRFHPSGVSTDDYLTSLARLNQLYTDDPLTVDSLLALPPPWPQTIGGTHTVVPGETLLGLASRYRPSEVALGDYAAALAEANGGDSAMYLRAGDVLALPSSAALRGRVVTSARASEAVPTRE
ncbi:MAG: LysM peptidoglycan-binding domain-containing protein [Dehalococcoidia bacterium]